MELTPPALAVMIVAGAGAKFSDAWAFLSAERLVGARVRRKNIDLLLSRP